MNHDLRRSDVRRLRAFRTLLHGKGDSLTFRQCLETVRLDGAVVNEHVRAAVFLGDETETFRFVKPLNST